AAAALALAAVPGRVPGRVFTGTWIAVSAADLALVAIAWAGYRPGRGYGWAENVAWIPGAGGSYHVAVGAVGLSLPALPAFLFLAVGVSSLREPRRAKAYVCLFLSLQTVCLGLFTALDLILFFVYFDLSIVGMFFVIAGWGHGGQAR